MPTYDYQCEKCGIIEIRHSMNEEVKTVCPQCGKEGLRKMLSTGGAVIIGNRELNQYNDVHLSGAKTWRDKNGNLHPVTPGDGHSKSGTTTSRKYRTDEQIAEMKKRDKKIRHQKQQKESYQRFVNRTKK